MHEYFLKEKEFCSSFIQALVHSDIFRKNHLFLISLIIISYYLKTISKNTPY